MNENTYTVLSNDKIGRYAVAAKVFQPGELIFTETPFAVGPKPDTPPVCLGCYSPVDATYLCSKCGWPVCSAECEAITAHSNAECKIFAETGAKWQRIEDLTTACPQYDCITPLRVLLMKDTNPERWQKEVQPMQSHNEIRKERQSSCWEANRVNVVEYLRDRCKLADRYSEELIHTVCGILEVNAFEARSRSGYSVRALYPQLAILSHSCIPNTVHSIVPGPTGDENDFRVNIRAATKIESNAELFSSYTYILAPTLIRREHLLQSKYFECTCARCADPTEFGTHMSSLKCNKCDPGLIMSTNPLMANAEWKCTHCDFKTSGHAVHKVFTTIQSELDMADELGTTAEGIEMREKLYRKYRSVLHPRHAFFTSLRQSLSQMYGRTEGYLLDDLPDLLLERKVEMCKQLLETLDVIEPGYTRLRGMTLYELHAPLIFLARNQCQQGFIDTAGMRTKLEEAASLLEQSAKILSHEDPNSPEGIIGVIASQSLQQLRANMDAMIAACE